MARSSDPIIWPDNSVSTTLNAQMDRNYNDAITTLQAQWYQADLDQRFVIGDQDFYQSLFGSTGMSRRKMFNFNVLNSTLQMVSGHQRRNRKSTIVTPVLPIAQRGADQFTKCMFHVHSNTGAYQIYSDAFEQGALTQGIGLVSIINDYTNDPISGNISMRYIDFKSVLIDPFFRKADLSDCRFIWTRQFFDKQEAMLLYPKIKDEIQSMGNIFSTDAKFYFMPENYQFQNTSTFAMDEYWYLSTREAEYLIDSENGEIQEFTGDKEDLKYIMAITNGKLKLIKRPKQTVRRTLLLNNRVVVDEPNPYGLDRYPFVAFLGYFTPDTPYYAYKFRGIIRDARDAQYLFNRRKVTDLDILESQQQGLKVKKGSLVTPADGMNNGNGRMLVINEKNSMDDVQPMQIIPPSATMIQMEEMLQNVVTRITGVNEELLGSAVDDKAGILSMLRQGAGLTTLQRLFDQFDESQRQCGDIIVEIIQKNWTYQKVKMILGEDPVEEFTSKAFFQYGCKVVQGVLTETQQQLELQQLLYLYELTGGTQPILLHRAIEVSTIQEKDKLIEQMRQAQQAQEQQAQQMQQMQMQQMQVDTETKLAYARSQDGLARERVAKIQTDKAVAEDKLSRAQNEDTASMLNLVKTLKELQGMDISNFVSQIEALHRINSLEFQDKKQEFNNPTEGKNERQVV